MSYRLGRWSAAALVAASVAVGGCAAKIETRGNMPEAEALAKVKPGEMSKTEVEEVLGSPSSVAAFDENTWYYISKKTSTWAFYEPEVLESQVLVLRFDPSGVLSDIKRLDQNDARDVKVVSRETMTAGNEMTILQQLFGNLGKFNKDPNGKKK